MDIEKRVAGDYTITNTLHIGDREVVMGENFADEKQPYMVAFCERDELLARYFDVLTSTDYTEIVKLYGERIIAQAELVKENAKALDVPESVITKEDCIPDDYSKSINGKVIAINPDVLRNEYRRADRQLYLVTGGFGAEANSRGSAVFCKNLHTGENTRFERRDVMGEVKPDRLPDWAKEKINALLEPDKPKKHKSRER
ncbi:MAG TPA: hypothetical protein GX401_03690 [Clostridiales bacterium]|nr:hypothetical protein [Clostridiales bacterium]